MDDDVINVSSFEQFKKRMREEEKASVTPCINCKDNGVCNIVSVCPDYQKYRKKKIHEYTNYRY